MITITNLLVIAVLSFLACCLVDMYKKKGIQVMDNLSVATVTLVVNIFVAAAVKFLTS